MDATQPIKSIALIPARGGSKRFPRKNITPLAGKPLICWTIEKVLEANCFDCVMVSSDDPEILAIAGAYQSQGLVLHERPDEFASDTATVTELIDYLIDDLCAQGQEFKIFAEFPPTCPFRSVLDIHAAMQLLTPDIDAVVSMKQSPCVPDFIFEMDEQGQAIPMIADTRLFKGVTRRQSYKPMYYPNGAIYIGWIDAFKRNRGFYSNNMKIFSMPEFRSVDIDTREDLVYAEAVFNYSVEYAQ
ncbi:MAG: acylneuraminate cytidylyltransferase family protein [Methyloprofundus sp.]|nr:acylneuraminate cytidylyltransferase family protein [Methyloprofundus sp.]